MPGAAFNRKLFEPMPDGTRNEYGGVEMYGAGSPRFFTVTGLLMPGFAGDVGDIQAAVNEIHAKFGRKENKPSRADQSGRQRRRGIDRTCDRVRAEAERRYQWQGRPSRHVCGGVCMLSIRPIRTGGAERHADVQSREDGRRAVDGCGVASQAGRRSQGSHRGRRVWRECPAACRHLNR